MVRWHVQDCKHYYLAISPVFGKSITWLSRSARVFKLSSTLLLIPDKQLAESLTSRYAGRQSTKVGCSTLLRLRLFYNLPFRIKNRAPAVVQACSTIFVLPDLLWFFVFFLVDNSWADTARGMRTESIQDICTDVTSFRLKNVRKLRSVHRDNA